MPNSRKNMSSFDFLTSRFFIIKDILRYRNAYRNFLSVIYHTVKRNYPIKVVLKNGETKLLNNRIEVYTTSLGMQNYLNFTENILTISYDSKKIKFHDAISNGDICGIFFKHEYEFLPVKGKTVVDIGANIGDSAIYFAVNDAEKVIALEPFFNNFETAQTNIKMNGLENKIELLLAGCSGKTGQITVDNKGNVQTSLQSAKTGKIIPLITLEDIIKKYHLKSALLKMDCEGCEYDTILNTNEQILEKFSHIQVEYHYGYKNLKSKLEKCGFKVSITKPVFNLNYDAIDPKMYIGFLYAKRITK